MSAIGVEEPSAEWSFAYVTQEQAFAFPSVIQRNDVADKMEVKAA